MSPALLELAEQVTRFPGVLSKPGRFSRGAAQNSADRLSHLPALQSARPPSFVFGHPGFLLVAKPRV
jgi:hypothetical protein